MPDNKVVAGVQGMEDPVVDARISVTKAKNVLDDLLAQQNLLVSKELLLQGEMRKLGYSTFSGKDEKSRARLTEIIQQHFILKSDLTALEGAVSEARERLTSAENHERLELQKAKARMVLERLDDLNDTATSCDHALKNFLKAFDTLEKQAAAICAVTNHPQREILRVLSKRALQTHLLGQVRVFDLGVLAPGERLTFADMSAGWSRIASGWCQQRLGSPKLAEPDLDAAE
jgi:hypothetical protein